MSTRIRELADQHYINDMTAEQDEQREAFITALEQLATNAWQPRTGTIEDDLRSRIGCILEATFWDRPYDERLAAIRGMCDLTTDGLTATADAEPGR